MKQILFYFWEEMKPYKWWYLLLFQTLITWPFYTVILNYAVKILIDIITVSENFEMEKFYFPVSLYVFAEVYVNIVWRLSNFAGMNCIPQTLNAVVLKSYNYVQHHSYRFFTENMTGSIASKIDGIASGFNNLRDGIHFRLGGAIARAFVSISVIAFVAPLIALLIAVWIVPYFFITKKLALKLEEASDAEAKAKHEVKGMIADRISNIFNLFSFATRKKEHELLGQYIKKNVLPKQRKTWKAEIIFHTVAALFYIVLLGAIMWGVIYYRYFGGISIGMAVFVLSMVWQFMEAFWQVSTDFGAFLKDMGDLKASFEIIKKPQEILDKKDAIELII